jgi:phosphate transport system substrate-binding protein
MKKINRIFILSILIGFLFFNPALAEKLVIKGSTTVLPIAEKISAAYMANNPGVTIEISGGGSGNGIKAIIDGTTDIGNASRFIKGKELNYALGRNIYPVPFRIAYDCIVPVVHPSNPVADLSVDELKQIYTGEVRNWSQFSGKNHEIAVISRDASSGTYEVWKKKIMDKAAIYPGAVLKPGNSEVVTEVSKNPDAIGYIGLGYYNSLVKMLSVNGIKGNVATTLDGTYPISRPLYMFTRGWPCGETLKFINYVLEPGLGQKQVSSEGFVSLYSTPSPSAIAEIPTLAVIPETPSNIKMVQQFLNTLGYPAGPVDGIKGQKTNAAMVQFKKENGLPIDLRLSESLITSLTDKYMEQAGYQE